MEEQEKRNKQINKQKNKQKHHMPLDINTLILCMKNVALFH